MAFRTPFTLRGLVIHNISVVSGFPESAVTAGKRLRLDLLMTVVMRQALAPGFQKIARVFKRDALVRRSDCEDLDTVGDAVKLVAKAAGGVDPDSPIPPGPFLAAGPQ